MKIFVNSMFSFFRFLSSIWRRWIFRLLLRPCQRRKTSILCIGSTILDSGTRTVSCNLLWSEEPRFVNAFNLFNIHCKKLLCLYFKMRINFCGTTWRKYYIHIYILYIHSIFILNHNTIAIFEKLKQIVKIFLTPSHWAVFSQGNLYNVVTAQYNYLLLIRYKWI